MDFILCLILPDVIARDSERWQSAKPIIRKAVLRMVAQDKSEPSVFFAEDSDDDAYFFQRAFQKADLGCNLVRAENGKVAIELLKGAAAAASAGVPVLIFLDLKMPVMSGFEVLEWLRFSGLEPMPKVIVLSGSNDEDDRGRALKLGAADYLVKPITADLLKERVRSQLEEIRQKQRERARA